MAAELSLEKGVSCGHNAVAIDWRALLAAELARAPRGKAGVAERLGFSRVYVSRVMSTGSSAYADVPQKFIDRVISRFHVVSCPARAGQEMPYADCAKGNGPAPTHNPLAMHIWRECQRCPNKPTQEVAP